MAKRRRISGTRKPNAHKRLSRHVNKSTRPPLRTQSDVKGVTFPYVEMLTKAENSQQLVDPFENLYESGTIAEGTRQALKPYYDFQRLAILPHENNVLKQCIESYVTNIESHNHVLEYIGKDGGEQDDDVQEEKSIISSFLVCPGMDISLREIRERSRVDYETLGGCFYEISRNEAAEVVHLDHIPGVQMRLTTRDAEATLSTVRIPHPDVEGEFIEKEVSRHFRRYIQNGPRGKKVYFKEFGDPRKIDPQTGDENDTLDIEDEATEVYYRYQYSPASVYGFPRWIGNLPAILGSRESEVVNLNFFRENAIPAMAVLISGGALTDDSFERVEEYINAVRGQDSMQRVMILEAAADEGAGDIEHSQPAPKIELKPMISERQQEGLFQDYDQKNMAKVRSSFRLPPIFIGRAEDYTRASAFASMMTAESQIFSPERAAWDAFMNNVILSTYDVKYWRFKSTGASLAEPDTLSKMIDSFGKQGALTPNSVIKIANQMLDVKVEPVLEDWGDIPFAVIMEYVRGGREVEGLDDFLIELDLPETPPVPANSNGNAPAATAVTNLKADLNRIRDDLMEAVQEGLQTSAIGD